MTTEPRRKLDEYGPEEMAIPEWKMVQKVGGDWAKGLGAQPGQFHNSITDEIVDEVNIVVVDVPSGRARWGEEITSEGPVCASYDARSNESIYGDDCSQCEYRLDAPWSVEAGERRKKCCLNYTILGIDLDHDYLPVMVRAHGISALPIRQLIAQLKMNRALRGEYYRAIVNIKSQAKDTRYGTAYALHPRITSLITDEAKTKELKVESQRLLGAPIPLPEARPEGEPQPLGFMPDGMPFYSEEEKEKLLAQAASPAAAAPGTAAVTKTPAAQKTEPGKEGKKETQKKDLDLDF